MQTQKLAVIITLLGMAASLFAANGVWTNLAGGSWGTAANWTNGIIAANVGSTADFSQLTLSAAPTVTLGAPFTNGFLIFGDQGNTYGWTLNSGGRFTNTLAVASGTPGITVNGQGTTINSVLAGTQGLVITGPGALTLTASNTYAGGTTINNALVVGGSQYALGANNTVVSAVTVNAGATLDIDGSAALSGGFWYGLTLAGNGTAGQGALVNNGANGAPGQRQTSNISLAGNTTIGGSGNIMLVGSSYSADTLALNGYTLTKVGGNAFNLCNTTVSGAGPVIVNGGTFGQYHTASVASGTAFSLANSNGVTLALSNLSMSIGSLTGGGTIGGNVLLGSGTLTAGGDNTSPAGFAGVISGTGGLTKIGTGTLTLSGANTYTGSTAVSNGTMLVTGSLANTAVTVYTNGWLVSTGTLGGSVTVRSGGTLAVGPTLGSTAVVGTMTIASTLTLNAGSTNFLRLTKTGGTAVSDEIAGLTGATLGGTLVVSNTTSDGTALATGDTFTLFGNAGAYAGGFNNIVLPTLPSGLSWDVSQLPVNGSISVINTAATPFFNLATGGYVGAQMVTINSLTPGATIYYTTNGNTPTTNSLIYAGAITVPVNATETIQAFATAPGFSPSVIASATYTTEASAVWTNGLGGSWSLAGNWINNIIPNGNGVTADFSQLTLTGNTDVTLDGAWTIGNLIVGDAGNSYIWEIDNGAAGPLTLAGTGPNTPTITVSNQTLTITAALAGTNGLIKSGGGRLILSGTNEYTGLTTVAGGTLELAGYWNTSFAAGGGSYTINNGAVLQEDNSTAHYNVGSNTIVNINGGGELLWNSIGGDSYSTYLNTVNLNSANGLPAVVDTTTLSDSVPRFGHYANGLITSTGATVTNLWNGGFMLVSGSPYTVTVSNSAPLIIAGAIYDLSGYAGETLFITGPSSLTLAGANTYTGNTTISNGTVVLTGSLAGGTVTVGSHALLVGNGQVFGSVALQSGGTLAVDTSVNASAVVGELSIAGTLSANSGSTTFLRLTKTGGAAAQDQFVGMSAVTYGGTLLVTNITSDGTPLASGDTFTLFHASANNYAGGFNNIILPALAAGLSWDVSQLTVSGAITVNQTTATPAFNPVGGVYFGPQPLNVTISSITPGATIYYTTDGSTPGTSSASGHSPLTISVPANTNLLLQAFAAAVGFPSSAVANASYTTEATAVWTNGLGGSWSLAGNWINNIIPDANGVIADFSQLILTTNTDVTLDGAWTVGGLVFGDVGNSYSWEVDPGSAGPLTLATPGTNAPTITVSNQSVNITATLAGTEGLTKAGAGRLILSGTNSYTGLTTVAGGTLELAGDGNTSFSGGGGSYLINNGAILQEDNSAAHYNVGSATIVTITGGGKLAWNAAGGDAYSTYLNTVNLDSSDGLPAMVDTTQGDSVPRFGYYANGLITSTGATMTNLWNGGFMLVNGGGYTITVSNSAPLYVSSAIYDLLNYAGAPLIKTGAATLVLAGTNTYAGSTTVGGGTLFVEGSLAAGGLLVQNSASLGGAGSVGGVTTVQAGGLIQAGDANGSNTLTIATLNLGSTSSDVTYCQFTVKAGGKIAATTLNVAGTNIINILDPSLAWGTNTLFTYAGGAVGGGSGFGGFQLGLLPVGVTAHLVNTGSAVQLGVTSFPATVATNSPVLANAFNGSALTLSWPVDHLGWRLQVQTNSLNAGLGTNWVTWPNSTNLTSVPVVIDPRAPTVYYRLVYP